MSSWVVSFFGAILGMINFLVLTLPYDERMLWGGLLSALAVPITKLIWSIATKRATARAARSLACGEPTLDLILERYDPIVARQESH